MKIENYPTIHNSSSNRNYIDFVDFIVDFDNGLNNINFLPLNTNLSNMKLYFAKDLNIPKDRLKRIEKKYNIKRTINVDKADVIFSDFFNKKHFLESKLTEYISTFDVISRNDPTSWPRVRGFQFLSYDNIMDTINSKSSYNYYGINDNVDQAVLNVKDAEKISNAISHYFKNIPILCISDIAEEDLQMFSKLEIEKFIKRLTNQESVHFTLLNIYSNYNVNSIKAYFKKANYLSYHKGINIRNLDRIRNKDVYTKYILKNINNTIWTANPSIKSMYYFKNINDKFYKKINFHTIISNTYKLKKLIKTMAQDPDNLKQYLHFLISDPIELRDMESNLINFEILPDNDKKLLINKTLDLLSTLISNGSIEDLKSEYDL